MTSSHHHCQSLRLRADYDGLAAADAHVSEDPQVDGARQGDSQGQEQEADEALRAEQYVGGGRGVLRGILGYRKKETEGKRKRKENNPTYEGGEKQWKNQKSV